MASPELKSGRGMQGKKKKDVGKKNKSPSYQRVYRVYLITYIVVRELSYRNAYKITNIHFN